VNCSGARNCFLRRQHFNRSLTVPRKAKVCDKTKKTPNVAPLTLGRFEILEQLENQKNTRPWPGIYK